MMAGSYTSIAFNEGGGCGVGLQKNFVRETQACSPKKITLSWVPF